MTSFSFIAIKLVNFPIRCDESFYRTLMIRVRQIYTHTNQLLSVQFLSEGTVLFEVNGSLLNALPCYNKPLRLDAFIGKKRNEVNAFRNSAHINIHTMRAFGKAGLRLQYLPFTACQIN